VCFGGEKGTKTSMYLEAPAHSGCIVGKPAKWPETGIREIKKAANNATWTYDALIGN
jgi:hypothetical protein